MSTEKDKVSEKDQQTIESPGGKRDELSEKELDQTSGGITEKWINIQKTI